MRKVRYEYMHANRGSTESVQKNKMQQQKEKEKVHSEMIRAGKKNYFFDVKKASNGSSYLTIAESYLGKDGQKVINRLMIFKDHFSDFGNAMLGLKQYFE
jgi:hypothetical protein